MVHGDLAVRAAKQLVWDVFTGERPSPLAESVTMAGPATVGAIDGSHAVHDQINEPLLDALLKPRWAPRAFIGGFHGEELWVAHIGTLSGVFVRDLWGIPASGRQASIRFGEFSRVAGDRIHEVRSVVDLPWLAAQAGLDSIPEASAAPEPPAPPVRSFHPEAAAPTSTDTTATAILLEQLLDRWRGSADEPGLSDLWSTDAEVRGSYGLDQIRWHGAGADHLVDVPGGPLPACDPADLVTITEGDVAAVLGRPAPGQHDRPELRVMAFLTRSGASFTDAQVLVDLVNLTERSDLDLLGTGR